MAFFFSAQISISSFCSQEMRLPSFIFNWISNINLLSFTGPFMSPSLPSKLFRGGIKGFACPLHYSSSWITHPQPARSNKTGMEILRKIHSPPVLILIFCSAKRILIPSHILFKKTKKKHLKMRVQWRCRLHAKYMFQYSDRQLLSFYGKVNRSRRWAVIGRVNGCFQSGDLKR